jgi:phosphoribosyl 1,2-cyclic phosphate phosphodiesterase
MPVTLTLLGTGTSQGVPVIACQCTVCQSPDSRDKRLRTSALFEVSSPDPSVSTRSLVVDSGPDFRQQMLSNRVARLDAVLFTHEHKDHVAGLDDVRAFNFHQQRDMEVFASSRVQVALRREFHYAFNGSTYPGIPRINLNEIDDSPFRAAGVQVMPLAVRHHQLPVYGFRIEDVAYITDANFIEPATWERLEGLDVLVLNALRKEPHISHFSLDEALEVIEKIKPRRAFLTHLSHLMGTHDEVESTLPTGVRLGVDGMIITSP